jgi:hypothetical protein
MFAQKPFYHNSCHVVGSFPIATIEKTLKHFATPSQIWILKNKVPGFDVFKLGCTPIIPYPLPLR